MAFITQYFKKMHRFERGRSFGARILKGRHWGLAGVMAAFVLALLPMGVLAQFAPAPTVQVADLALERVDDAYLLSTTLGFELPTPVEEALNKGVALYFLSQAEVFKERWYWYEKSVALQERHYRLSYHPLVSPVATALLLQAHSQLGAGCHARSRL